MATVASQLIEKVTAHAQSDSLEVAREICADGTYFPNNQRIFFIKVTIFEEKKIEHNKYVLIFSTNLV